MKEKLSAEALEKIAKDAAELARELRGKEPTYALALAAGIEDTSYSTVRYGRVASYSGTATITMADGSKWSAVGHRPTGPADYVARQGYIEFKPLQD